MEPQNLSNSECILFPTNIKQHFGILETLKLEALNLEAFVYLKN